MYLLDTHVVSELRKAAKADPNVRAWGESIAPCSLFLSSIVVLELQLGVLLMERRDPAQGAISRAWLDLRVLPAFAGRILPVDQGVALRCAQLHVPVPRPPRDAMIAATALVHGMTEVTRDVADFHPTGVSTLNPCHNPSE